MIFWENYSLDKNKIPYQEIAISNTEPTNEPVTLTEIKNYLKIDYLTDDTLLSTLIFSARKQVENELGGLPIVKRTFTQTQTGGVDFIELFRSPVNSITSVTYFESFDSTGETLAITDYRLANGNIYHIDGYFKVGRLANGYSIVFNAGLVDDTTNGAASAPSAIKTAIMRYVAYLYENREEFASTISEGNWSISYSKSVANEVKMLLMPYHTGRGVI